MKEKIADFLGKKVNLTVERNFHVDSIEKSCGYIVDVAEDFIVLQETDDFELRGFLILPLAQITRFRNNQFDKYYDRIMTLEGQKAGIGFKTKVDLSSWATIGRTFQKKKQSVIVECEHPDIDTFTIGQIKRITKDSFHMHHFDADGFLDDTLVRVEFQDITKILFDDRYVDVFSKYTRIHKKPKASKKIE